MAKLNLLFCISILTLSLSLKALPGLLTGDDIINKKRVEILLNKSSKKATVVAFLSANCPCSDSHVAELKRLANKFPEMQFVGLHSNANETIEDSRKYFSEKDFVFPILQDENGLLADEFKAYKTPHVFVISSGGEVLYSGGISDSSNFQKAKYFYLLNAIEDIQAGRPVKQPQGRTLGCVIMRASDLKKNVW